MRTKAHRQGECKPDLQRDRRRFSARRRRSVCRLIKKTSARAATKCGCGARTLRQSAEEDFETSSPAARAAEENRARRCFFDSRSRRSAETRCVRGKDNASRRARRGSPPRQARLPAQASARRHIRPGSVCANRKDRRRGSPAASEPGWTVRGSCPEVFRDISLRA